MSTRDRFYFGAPLFVLFSACSGSNGSTDSSTNSTAAAGPSEANSASQVYSIDDPSEALAKAPELIAGIWTATEPAAHWFRFNIHPDAKFEFQAASPTSENWGELIPGTMKFTNNKDPNAGTRVYAFDVFVDNSERFSCVIDRRDADIHCVDNGAEGYPVNHFVRKDAFPFSK